MNTEHGLMMAPAANRAVMLTRGQLASWPVTLPAPNSCK